MCSVKVLSRLLEGLRRPIILDTMRPIHRTSPFRSRISCSLLFQSSRLAVRDFSSHRPIKDTNSSNLRHASPKVIKAFKVSNDKGKPSLFPAGSLPMFTTLSSSSPTSSTAVSHPFYTIHYTSAQEDYGRVLRIGVSKAV